MKNLIQIDLVFTLRLIATVLAMVALSWIAVEKSFAFEKTARPSARLSLPTEQNTDNREEILKKYLQKYDSPLAPHAGKFIDEADRNGLDWKLLVSIAGVESYFGHRIPPNSYNGWGWGVYGNNVHYFTSWDEGITEISGELRSKYMDKWGARNVYEIGSFYAEDPNWANKVSHFMDELSEFAGEEDKTLFTLSL